MSSARRVRRTAIAALALTVVAPACTGGPSSTTSRPTAGPSIPVSPSSEVVTVSPPTTLSISSPAFGPGAAIPRRFGCDGDDVSPPLAWSGAPAGTAAFALVVTDPDARGFVHWLATDIPATATGLAEGASGTAAAGVEGRNGFGRTGWGGPCPPSGTHHYQFELFALSAPLGLAGHPAESQVRAALGTRTLARAVLSGTYRRGG